jgi:hypothetical protein
MNLVENGISDTDSEYNNLKFVFIKRFFQGSLVRLFKAKNGTKDRGNILS